MLENRIAVRISPCRRIHLASDFESCFDNFQSGSKGNHAEAGAEAVVSKINDLYDAIQYAERRKACLIRVGKRETAEFGSLHMKSLELMDQLVDETPAHHGEIEVMLMLTQLHVENDGDSWHLSPYPRRVVEITSEAMTDIAHRDDDDDETIAVSFGTLQARDPYHREFVDRMMAKMGGDKRRFAGALSRVAGISLSMSISMLDAMERITAEHGPVQIIHTSYNKRPA